jgi:hypothetical protein
MVTRALQKWSAPADNSAGDSGREAGMTCTGCAKTPLIAISMKIAGRDVVFRRCSLCEANIWESEEGVLTLDRVLDMARVTR